MAMNPAAQSLMNRPLSTVTANLTKCALAQTQAHLTMRNQTKMRTLTMMMMMSEKSKVIHGQLCWKKHEGRKILKPKENV